MRGAPERGEKVRGAELFERFAGRVDDERGVTLGELLISILVIAILAAVSQGVYLHQRRKGWASQVISATKNLASLQEYWVNTEGRIGYTSDLGFLVESGYTYSTGDVTPAIAAAGTDSYCLEVSSVHDPSIVWHYNSTDGRPEEGPVDPACVAGVLVAANPSDTVGATDTTPDSTDDGSDPTGDGDTTTPGEDDNDDTDGGDQGTGDENDGEENGSGAEDDDGSDTGDSDGDDGENDDDGDDSDGNGNGHDDDDDDDSDGSGGSNSDEDDDDDSDDDGSGGSGGCKNSKGKGKSDPDGDENGGADQPGGSGGVDQSDQDCNNGSGNDDDGEDDNNGGGKGKGPKQ